MFSAATYQQRRSAQQQPMPDSLLLFVGNVDTRMNYHDNIFCHCAGFPFWLFPW